jgi:hypothetical protein
MVLGTVLWLATAAMAPCFVHSLSGIEFRKPPDLVCSEPRILDLARGDALLRSSRSRLTVTAYVYRKRAPISAPDESLVLHLEAVRAEVARRYTGLQCEPWVHDAHPRMNFLRCTDRSAEIGPDDLVTFIGLEDSGSWWLKVRATSPANDREASERDLAAVLQAIVAGAPSAE